MNQPTESEFLDDVGLKKPDRSDLFRMLRIKIIQSFVLKYITQNL